MLQFSLSEDELQKVEDFKMKHKCTLKDDPRTGGKRCGAIGGRFAYTFTPTTIGVIIVVRCACGQEQNVTDFSDW